MSNGSITISYTTLAEVALAGAFIAGVAFLGSSKLATSPAHPGAVPDAHADVSKPSAKSKKLKKKKGTQGSGNASDSGAATPLLDHAHHLKDDLVETASSAAQQVQTKAKQAADAVKSNETVQQAAQAVSNAAAGAAGSGGAAATGKGKKKKGAAAKAGSQKPPQQQQQSAAEAHAAARAAPPSSTDDMRDPSIDDDVKVSRVMKIVGGKSGADPESVKKQEGRGDEGWEKADAFDDDEGGWESVTAKKPSRPSTPSLASSAPAPARSIPGLTTPAQQAMTKKQRENAAKKAKEDALKRAKEDEQQERLRAHRRELERARLQEQEAARRARPSSQNFFGAEPTATSNKVLSGGMHASLDPTTGSLVWD
ncbi:hypothetical protein JCM5296_004634 [Sporobolomyces johnsonii]